MGILKKDFYHGAGLAQIVAYPEFKALNRGSGKYGHYLVNTGIHVFARYRTNDKGPWQFNFDDEDYAAFTAAQAKDAKVFVMLVCGAETICILSFDEFCQVVDVESKEGQYIIVTIPQGGSCHVHGSLGRLARTIPHSAFPVKIFE